ncbi:MAG: DUF6291 domain-containing protein [Prevotellaceae bacterium]|jgi:hypothetical protein|nr:DUF6291 domain-containing protein [Prevotellaceae bacterium]
MKNSFVFYSDWLKAIEVQPVEIQGDVLRGIAQYAINGNEIELKPVAQALFSLIKLQIDRDNEKYMSIVERNRANGSRGGRPQKNQNPKPKITQNNPKNPNGFSENPKKPYNDDDNDNDNDDENDFKKDATVVASKKDWRTDYEVYVEQLRAAYSQITHDDNFIRQQEKYNPGVDILMSVEKACINFWATEAGWLNKKKSRAKQIDWQATFRNAITLKSNRVYK